jgi:cation diffusion facilitator CzcD-associated flavoprotein CzcO
LIAKPFSHVRLCRAGWLHKTEGAKLIFDAVIIGAGAGDLSAAARLVAAGKKLLAAESRDRLK